MQLVSCLSGEQFFQCCNLRVIADKIKKISRLGDGGQTVDNFFNDVINGTNLRPLGSGCMVVSLVRSYA